MRQAITTRYIGPTNHRGARIRASAQVGSVLVGWDHALDVQANHAAAAKSLADKFGWLGDEHSQSMHGGALPDDRGYAFVMVPR